MSDELLNAYLDGELTDTELGEVEHALETSVSLRVTLAELESTRNLIRGLPMLERPAAIRPVTAPKPPSRRPHRVGIAIAAVAAVWLLIFSVGVSLGSLPIVPEVDQLAIQHAAAETGTDAMHFSEMDADSMMKHDPAIMADIGHGMGLDAVFQSNDIVQARYSDGEHSVSIFHEPGELDWDELPASGDVEPMPDGKIWRSTMDEVDVLVTQRGDLIVTVITDADMDDDMVVLASEMVPEVDDDPSWWDRIKAAPGNIIDRF